MPADADEKIDYRTLVANGSLAPWLASGSTSQPEIIGFISPGDDLGIAALLGNVAAAMGALDQRVKLLHVDGESQAANDLSEVGERLREMSDAADFLLVELPSRPTPFARAVLLNCNLIIVAGSSKIEHLGATENIVKELLYLGIDTEKVAGLLFDPEGILSSESLADIKPYLKASLGIEIAGVVSFESGPGSRMNEDIAQLTQYIISYGSRRLETAFAGAG
jgi:Flp pilus assembly CpaE family ATPase